VAHHVQRGEVRTFVLDRMRDTECATTERFELPSSFDVDQYFQGEFGIWRSETPHRVVVDFDAHAAEYVRSRKVHATQKLQSIAGGGVRLSMVVGNLNQVVSWVLEWGRRARVVEPPELVEQVQAELEGALERYRPASSRGRKTKRG
jgi:predicted DNA-binding transcriptional regulator YafY